MDDLISKIKLLKIEDEKRDISDDKLINELANSLNKLATNTDYDIDNLLSGIGKLSIIDNNVLLVEYHNGQQIFINLRLNCCIDWVQQNPFNNPLWIDSY